MMPLRLLLIACAVAPLLGCGMFKRDNSAMQFQVERQQLINRVNGELQLKQELEMKNQELTARLAEAEKEVARLADGRGVGGPMLEQLAAQHPGLTFDADARLARFHTEITFQPGQTALDPAARQSLDQLLAMINAPQARGAKLVIAGLGSDEGSAVSPLEVGAARAAAVAAYLREQGLPENTFGGLSLEGNGPASAGAGRIALFLAEPNAPVIARLGSSMLR